MPPSTPHPQHSHTSLYCIVSPLQARSPRPPSSVEKLLQLYSLQHYTEVLMANGYDDVQFVGEVSDLELQEIGILNASDRAKVNIGN